MGNVIDTIGTTQAASPTKDKIRANQYNPLNPCPMVLFFLTTDHCLLGKSGFNCLKFHVPGNNKII